MNGIALTRTHTHLHYNTTQERWCTTCFTTKKIQLPQNGRDPIYPRHRMTGIGSTNHFTELSGQYQILFDLFLTERMLPWLVTKSTKSSPVFSKCVVKSSSLLCQKRSTSHVYVLCPSTIKSTTMLVCTHTQSQSHLHSFTTSVHTGLADWTQHVTGLELQFKQNNDVRYNSHDILKKDQIENVALIGIASYVLGIFCISTTLALHQSSHMHVSLPRQLHTHLQQEHYVCDAWKTKTERKRTRRRKKKVACQDVSVGPKFETIKRGKHLHNLQVTLNSKPGLKGSFPGDPNC